MSRKHVTKELRKFIIERAQGCCEYCRSQAKYASHPFEVDHIIPVKEDGPTTLDNLAFACRGCNLRKRDDSEAADPQDNTLVPLFNPRRQRWRDHFRWNEDSSEVIGLTPTGRATVEALQMNRQGLINLREVLFELGQHPPDFG